MTKVNKDRFHLPTNITNKQSLIECLNSSLKTSSGMTIDNNFKYQRCSFKKMAIVSAKQIFFNLLVLTSFYCFFKHLVKHFVKGGIISLCTVLLHRIEEKDTDKGKGSSSPKV